MSLFVPDFAFENVSDITMALIKKRGLNALILDLDGTLCPSESLTVPEKTAEWLNTLLSEGIKLYMLSNNGSKARVAEFCEKYRIKHYANLAHKPLSKGFKTAMLLLNEPAEKIGIVGDQIFTDTFGGNRMGMTTFFVKSINKPNLLRSIRYFFEKPFVKQAERSAKEGL